MSKSNLFILEVHERNRTMMTLEQSINLFHLLSKVVQAEVSGAVVELGCYRGLTAVLMQKTLDHFESTQELHVFDSFEGIPQKASEDIVDAEWEMRPCDRQDNQRLKQGWFCASVEDVIKSFQEFGVKQPEIHAGWFEATLPTELPDQLAFVHIDGDMYSSTLTSLQHCYPRLSPGAIMLIDDYCDPEVHGHYHQYPGVKRACDTFFADKVEKPEVLIAGRFGYHAFVQKSG